MSENNFNINSVYIIEDSLIELTTGDNGNEYDHILIPNSSKVEIRFTLNQPATNLPNSYIKVQTGSSYEIYSLAEVDPASLKIEILIPKLNSNTSEISFSCCNQAGEYIIDSASKTFHNYLYPLELDFSETNLKRCNKQYQDDLNGEYIKVQKIKFNTISGNIDNIIKFKLVIHKYAETSQQSSPIILIDTTVSPTIENYNATIGYSDTAYEHLLSNLNEQSFFKDLKFTYDFSFTVEDTPIIKTTTTTEVIEVNGETETQTTTTTEVIGNPRVSTFIVTPNWAYVPLQLVGKTICNDNSIVYGGIAIGQNPTINEIGQPAFECGYPAYFNGMKYGYYSNDIFEINDSAVTFSGFLTSSKQQLSITFYVGQPIFANDFDIEGDFIAFANKAYLTGATYDAPTIISASNTDIKKVISNKKAGIVTITITKNNWGDHNNHPIAIRTKTGLKITFK